VIPSARCVVVGELGLSDDSARPIRKQPGSDPTPLTVIPTQAGTQYLCFRRRKSLGPRLHGDDKERSGSGVIPAVRCVVVGELGLSDDSA